METQPYRRDKKTRAFVSAALVAGIALVSPGALVPSAGAAVTEPADFRAQADALLAAAVPADGPGLAVIVTRGGKVIYEGGRGLADLEGGQPVSPDTVFRIGSISKQFTAAVILQLVAEGRIGLDDPISRFFSDWPQPAGSATVRQLLNHVSGIQDYTKIPGWIPRNRARSFTTAQLLAVFRDLPSPSRPGQSWEYNNGGYVVLGAIIEQVTGRPWHEAVTQRIARPLGLTTLAVGGAPAAGPHAALGYTRVDGRHQPARPTDMSVPHAAGGLVASARDLAAWAHALHHGRVVTPALYREMIQPARLANGSAEPYGFGVRLAKLRGQPAIVHGGAIAGFDSDGVYIPSQDVFVAVLANTDEPAVDPSIISRRLAALAIGNPFPTFARADVDPASVAPLFGAYTPTSGPPRRFFSRDGKLFVGRGDDEIQVFAAGEDRFFFGPDGLDWVRFVRDSGGAHVLEAHRSGEAQPERFVRTGPVPPPVVVRADLLRAYAGTYATETVPVTITLREDGRLSISPAGQAPLLLRPVSDTEFMVDGRPMRVIFHRDGDAVNRLTLHRGARQLNGRRTGS